MGKVLVRLTVVFTAIYFILSFVVAQFLGIDILDNWHTLFFELCVIVYTFSEGAFHCRYIRYSAISIFICDLLTQLDNTCNFLSVNAHNMIPITILTLGIGTSITLALRHFYKVNKLRNKRNEQWK